jgi:hypothetical protein
MEKVINSYSQPHARVFFWRILTSNNYMAHLSMCKGGAVIRAAQTARDLAIRLRANAKRETFNYSIACLHAKSFGISEIGWVTVRSLAVCAARDDKQAMRPSAAIGFV